MSVDHGRGQRLDGETLARQRGRIDFQTRIGSLARARRPDIASFPHHKGYLQADPYRVETLRRRLSALGPGLKVGLSWRGGLERTGSARRSLLLSQLAPLTELEGCQFVNLQYNTTDDERRLIGLNQHNFVHWQDVLDDYEQTAALVKSLDLVISVCTAVIHLGGALGQPVWVLVPHGAEWRYGSEGERMVWYPSVRLVRQESETESWTDVIKKVVDGLQALVAQDARLVRILTN